MQYRVLWVGPHERQLKCGEVYSEGQLREAGYDPAGMVTEGAAEKLASSEPSSAPKKKKG